MAASVSMSSGSLRRGNPGGGPQTAERSTWSVLADSILGVSDSACHAEPFRSTISTRGGNKKNDSKPKTRKITFFVYAQALYLASKKPRTSSRMAVLLVVVSSVQLIALAVGLLDAATEMQKAHAGMLSAGHWAFAGRWLELVAQLQVRTILPTRRS